MNHPATLRTPTEALSRALADVEGAEEVLLADLGALIEIDTSFPPGAGYAAFAERVETMLRPQGYASERIVVPQRLWDDGAAIAHGERINVVARRPGQRHDPCSIYFHVDTVPAGDGWTRPAHALTREGDRVFGRGAADMKGTIAAVVAALRLIERRGLALRHEPILLFCTDEEGGLYPGIRYLAEAGRIEGHLLSFNGGAVPRTWAGCFGSVDLLIDVKGRSTHSGDPASGVNAIEAALPVLTALSALGRQVGKRVSALPSPPSAKGEPLRARLTLAGVQSGGLKGSATPGRCRIVVNRRYTPEEDFDDVLGELRAAVAEAMAAAPEADFGLRVIGHLAPVADPTGPHWPRWRAALAEGFGWAADDFHSWGASSSSDMGWAQQAGVREILLGGLSRPTANVHGPDEHTTLTDLKALTRSVLLYLADDFDGDVPA